MRIVLINGHQDNPELDQGVISEIDSNEGIVQITTDGDKSLTRLALSSCINFDPRVGDKVEILEAENGEIPGWLVIKLPQTA